MKSKLIALLESLGYPVYLQGTFPEDKKYPNSFFTFWTFEADSSQFYDNKARACRWGFWVYFYSNDPEKTEKIPLKAKVELEREGFAMIGKPVDCKSDEPTHTGCMMTAYYLEIEKENEDE